MAIKRGSLFHRMEGTRRFLYNVITAIDILVNKEDYVWRMQRNGFVIFDVSWWQLYRFFSWKDGEQ